MYIVNKFQRLASATSAFFGPHGAVTEQAQQRGISRQAVYREAEAVLDAVDGSAVQQQFQQFRQRIHDLEQRLAQSEQHHWEQQRYRVVLDPDKQAEFASTAQAEGVSLPVAQRLLRVCLGKATPCVAQLGRFSAAAAKRSKPLLGVFDELSRPLARLAAPDEIFVGRKPVLMVVEPESFCWLQGRQAATRDGKEWAKEFRLLPALEMVMRDAGTGLEKGLRQVNKERQQERERQQQEPKQQEPKQQEPKQQEPQLPQPIGDQLDHFHTLREGGRALRKSQGRANKALERAEKAERKLEWQARHGQPKSGYATVTKQRWQQAEQAFEDWTGNEQVWADIGSALKLFTPEGELNTRERAASLVRVAIPKLKGAEWDKTKRLLQRAETFTFLDRVHQQLGTVAVKPEVREVIVRSEGVRRQPKLAQGAGQQAAVVRALLLVWGVVIAKAEKVVKEGVASQAGQEAVADKGGKEGGAGKASAEAGPGQVGEEAVQQVRDILRQAWRASSLVEGLNSVVRMQQGRHRRLTQGLLDIKRLYWNCRKFRTGRRRKTSPYERLGLALPPNLSWWGLLKLSPAELRSLLLAHAPAALRQRWLAHGSKRLRQDLSAQQVAP
jgi:hypothetical protein